MKVFNTELLTVFLYPTLKCNLNCKMCYSSRRLSKVIEKRSELTLEQYFELIDILYQSGIRNFDISGGEPLLREDLDAIINKIKHYENTNIFMVSNGTLLEKLSVEKLKAIQRVDRFYVSLDSPIEEEHDQIRNVKGSFQRSLRGLKRLMESQFTSLGVNFVVMNSNRNSIPQLLEFCRTNHIRYINLLRFIDNSEDKALWKENLDKASYEQVFEQVQGWISSQNEADKDNDMDITLVLPGHMMKQITKKRARLHKEGIKLKVEYDPIRGCMAFEHSMVISSSGDITGCTGMIGDASFHAGNYLNQDFHEIINEFNRIRHEVIKVREMELSRDAVCQGCEDWHICRGGCPIVAKKYSGDIFSRDPSCNLEGLSESVSY